LREGLDRTVRGREELQDLLGVPPLAIIPHLFTRADQLRARMRLWVAVASTGAALVTAVVLVHFFYRPLDVVWAVALRKLGI
jgi:hypothetical protein